MFNEFVIVCTYVSELLIEDELQNFRELMLSENQIYQYGQAKKYYEQKIITMRFFKQDEQEEI